MILETPDPWDEPLGKWFDNVLNNPRVVKKIEVDHIVKVLGPDGEIIEMLESKLRAVTPLGLSLRRLENE